jgi:hypothetical protein
MKMTYGHLWHYQDIPNEFQIKKIFQNFTVLFGENFKMYDMGMV